MSGLHPVCQAPRADPQVSTRRHERPRRGAYRPTPIRTRSCVSWSTPAGSAPHTRTGCCAPALQADRGRRNLGVRLRQGDESRQGQEPAAAGRRRLHLDGHVPGYEADRLLACRGPSTSPRAFSGTSLDDLLRFVYETPPMVVPNGLSSLTWSPLGPSAKEDALGSVRQETSE